MDKMRTLVKWVKNLSSNNFSGEQSTAKMPMALSPKVEFKAAVIANEAIGHKRELNLLNKGLLLQKVEALQRDNALKEQGLQSAAMETIRTLMVRVGVLADELSVVEEGQEKMALTLLRVEEELDAAVSAREAMERGKDSILMDFGVLLQQLEALQTNTALKEQELNTTRPAMEAMERQNASLLLENDRLTQQMEVLRRDAALKEQESQTDYMEKMLVLEEEMQILTDTLYQEKQGKDTLTASLLQAQEDLNTTLSTMEAKEPENESVLSDKDVLLQEVGASQRDADLHRDPALNDGGLQRITSCGSFHLMDPMSQVCGEGGMREEEILADEEEVWEGRFIHPQEEEEELLPKVRKRRRIRARKFLPTLAPIKEEVAETRTASLLRKVQKKVFNTPDPWEEHCSKSLRPVDTSPDEDEKEPNRGCSIRHKTGRLHHFCKRMRKMCSSMKLLH